MALYIYIYIYISKSTIIFLFLSSLLVSTHGKRIFLNPGS